MRNIIIIGVLFLVAPVIKAAEVPRFPFAFASMTTEAVTLDGSLNEACWANAPVAGAFVDIYDNGKVVAVQTSFRMLYDAKALYIGIEAEDPDPGKLEMKKTEHDQWFSGDSLELFLDPGCSRNIFYQLAVGLGGGQYEGCMSDAKWDIQWQVITRINDKGWSAEIAIPFAELKVPSPVNGDVWGMNVCRNRKGGLQNSSTWTAVGGNFHNPGKFNVLIFGNAADYIKGELERGGQRKSEFEKQMQANNIKDAVLEQKIQMAGGLLQKLTESGQKFAADDMNAFLPLFNQSVKLRNKYREIADELEVITAMQRVAKGK